MKIFSVEQIREADKYTIEHEPIASIDLMERAAKSCKVWIERKHLDFGNILIFCGTGNNGGDGLAIARLFMNKGVKVKIVIANYSDKRSDEFLGNHKRLINRTKYIEINSINEIGSLQFNNNSGYIIIDALLGSGINKPAEGLIADCIRFINQQNVPVVSIDIPSGMYVDKSNDKNDVIVKATYTLSFQFPKLSFMFPENIDYLGELSILDIKLSKDFIQNTSTKNHFITIEDIQPILKKRKKNAHKGNFGHALIVAGSKGKMGAAVLASKACLVNGAGLVTAHIPECGYPVLQSSIPEVMVDADSEQNYITDNIRVEKYNAIAVGSGMGMEKQTQNVLKLLIQNSSVPIVFDADAINILSENKTWLSFVPANSIFTPHIGEFERLVGKVHTTSERLKQQTEFSIKYNVYVVLKGIHTSVSSPEGELFFNSNGNPGMATAGSGDVLTGIITSLIAQGYTSKQACILGVYLHGAAGDFASIKNTEETMIASDIIHHLTNAYKIIRKENSEI